MSNSRSLDSISSFATTNQDLLDTKNEEPSKVDQTLTSASSPDANPKMKGSSSQMQFPSSHRRPRKGSTTSPPKFEPIMKYAKPNQSSSSSDESRLSYSGKKTKRIPKKNPDSNSSPSSPNKNGDKKAALSSEANPVNSERKIHQGARQTSVPNRPHNSPCTLR